METKYDRLKTFVAENGWPRYRFNQILHAIFKERIGEFERMTTLPLPLRHQLRKRFGKSILHLTPVFRKQSGQADKVLFELPDSNKIETVRLIYRAGWQSYCISSQCGCGFGCSFCATGKIGFKRHLSADEITDQILYFHLQNHPIDSISLMGMGEALANPQTFSALKVLTDPRLFNLSPRRITVSTIGLIPQIERLSREFPQVNLTFSLHSPFDEQRSALMPINRKYPLNEVLEVLDAHIRKHRRKVYIAYIVPARCERHTRSCREADFPAAGARALGLPVSRQPDPLQSRLRGSEGVPAATRRRTGRLLQASAKSGREGDRKTILRRGHRSGLRSIVRAVLHSRRAGGAQGPCAARAVKRKTARRVSGETPTGSRKHPLDVPGQHLGASESPGTALAPGLSVFYFEIPHEISRHGASIKSSSMSAFQSTPSLRSPDGSFHMDGGSDPIPQRLKPPVPAQSH